MTKKYILCVMLWLFLLFLPVGKTIIVSAEDDETITDVMRGFSDTNKPDKETMQEVTSWSQGTLGVIVSVIIYIIFAAMMFTTACDLLYIGVPPARTLLYPSSGGSSSALVHDTSAYHDITQRQLNNGNIAETQNRAVSKSEGNYCLISNELKQLANANIDKMSMLKGYVKNRAVSLVVTTVVLILLVTTSLFTDAGLNIGSLILRLLGL